MKPFRWSIAKREQLGSLVDVAGKIELNEAGFLSDIRQTAARIITTANDADLAFIGRTPENFFDYLSGVFANIDEAPSLHLIHFSLRWPGPNGVRSLKAEQLKAFFDYLREEGTSAGSISAGAKPLALVDLVARGGTMKSFVELLHHQAECDGVDWNAVQRRLRIVGLRVRTHNSPKTWRWQHHQDWLHLIPDTVIKNVSVPAHLLFYLANDQPKVTQSFHPGRWGEADVEDILITDAQRQALALAVKLYDTGQSREERSRLASIIGKSREMRQPATRALVSRLLGRR